jgi:hypothetical protein
MQDGYVSHVELAHIVNTFADVVGGHHHHRVLYQVWSQVDHRALIVIADLLVLIEDWQVFAPEVTCKVCPVKDFLVWCWWVQLNVEVAGEVLLNLLFIRLN